MNKYYKDRTHNTPEISFDRTSGNFSIHGRSFHDDAFEFYKDLFAWLDEYLQVPLSSTYLEFNCDYFNTASYKCFVEMIRKLEKIKDNNHKVRVVWLYEKGDEESMEAGEDLREVTNLKIKVKPVELEEKSKSKLVALELYT